MASGVEQLKLPKIEIKIKVNVAPIKRRIKRAELGIAIAKFGFWLGDIQAEISDADIVLK